MGLLQRITYSNNLYEDNYKYENIEEHFLVLHVCDQTDLYNARIMVLTETTY